MVELVKKILELSRSGKRKNRRFSMTVSVSTFVPKTHTPFQWVPRACTAKSGCASFLRRRFRKLKGEFTWPKQYRLPGSIFGQGDRLRPCIGKGLTIGGKLEASNDQFDMLSGNDL